MKCATVACVKHERPHAVSSEQQSHSCLSLFLTGFMRISVAKDRRGSGTLWPTLNSFLKLLSHSFIKISVKYLFIQTVVTVTECVVSISTLFSCSVKTLFFGLLAQFIQSGQRFPQSGGLIVSPQRAGSFFFTATVCLVITAPGACGDLESQEAQHKTDRKLRRQQL